MGRSEYDPGAKDRRPWNAGRQLDAKRALKRQQVWAIRFFACATSKLVLAETPASSAILCARSTEAG